MCLIFKRRISKLRMTFDTIFANSPSNVNSQNELLTWCSNIPSKEVMILYEGSKTKVKVESQFSRILCNCWCTSGIYFATFVVCNCGGCCDRECKKKA